MMKTLSQIILMVVIAAAVSYGVGNYAKSAATAAQPVAASKLLDKIRCGYINYPPYFIKDSKTGEFSGIFYDLTQKISDEIGIAVEWSVESSFGSAPTDLAYKKFDVLCSGIWTDPKRARVAAFSIPAFYAPVLAYVRADDSRFDGKTLDDLIKDNKLKTAVVDGEFSDIIRKNLFPSAQVLAEPQNTSVSQLAEDVSLKKADITFLERSVASDYSKNNPGKIKELAIAPLHLAESVWAFNKDDNDLRLLFDIAIRKLNGNGYIDRVIRKYETSPGTLYRVAKPYEEAK